MESPIINNYKDLEKYLKEKICFKTKGKVNITLEDKWFFFLIRLIKFNLYGDKGIDNPKVKMFLITINEIECRILKKK